MPCSEDPTCDQTRRPLHHQRLTDDDETPFNLAVLLAPLPTWISRVQDQSYRET